MRSVLLIISIRYLAFWYKICRPLRKEKQNISSWSILRLFSITLSELDVIRLLLLYSSFGTLKVMSHTKKLNLNVVDQCGSEEGKSGRAGQHGKQKPFQAYNSSSPQKAKRKLITRHRKINDGSMPIRGQTNPDNLLPTHTPPSSI